MRLRPVLARVDHHDGPLGPVPPGRVDAGKDEENKVDEEQQAVEGAQGHPDAPAPREFAVAPARAHIAVGAVDYADGSDADLQGRHDDAGEPEDEGGGDLAARMDATLEVMDFLNSELGGAPDQTHDGL